MQSSPVAMSRMNVVDALRGFALAGIVLVHVVEQYIGAFPAAGLMDKVNVSALDGLIDAFIYWGFFGKFFALFSFLFGLSFFIQMDRAASRGVNFQGRFLWRLLLLFAIGYVHSLFYRGDILTIYALLGVFLIPFYRAPSALLLGIAAVVMFGLGRFLVFAAAGSEEIVPYGDGSPELAHNAQYFAAITSGTLFDVFAVNGSYGHLTKMEFQINVFGRAYITFAFFLLGLWVGRLRLFEDLERWQHSLRRVLWLAIAWTAGWLWLTNVLMAGLAENGQAFPLDTWGEMIMLTANDLFNFGVVVVIVCGFCLIYRRSRGQRVLGVLAPYGRTALSNYVLQSVIGTFIFFNWGLGLVGQLSNTTTFVLALGILTVQLLLSHWWLQHYRYGPLEWLWRSGTQLSWQPLARRPTAA